MKVKSFVVAGMIAAAISPAISAELNSRVDKNTGEIIFEDADSAKMIKMLNEYNAKLKLSEEIKAKRTRCLSNKDIWFDGNCISKNPCTSTNANDKKHCVKYFDKVQVATNTRAAYIVKTYAKNILKWEGCANLKVPKSKAAGQDYIMCTNPANGDVRMFEFDDMSESNNRLAASNDAFAMCLSLGGKAVFPKSGAEELTCSNVTKQKCYVLNGSFASNKCTIAF